MEYFKINLLILLSCAIICNGEFDIIELNHDLGPHTHFFPILVNGTKKIYEPFKYTVQEAGDARGFWLHYGEVRFILHMSTFVIAPQTHTKYGFTVDEIPLRNLFATAAVIDVRDKVRRNNTYLVTVEDVKYWVKENGMFPKHCIVLFNTGWDEGRYHDKLAYYGSDNVLKMKYPGVSREAQKYILDFEKSHGVFFVGFGIDTGTIHPQFYSFTDILFEKDKYSVNSLKDLNRLPPKGAKIMVMPLKITNGPGAPARVMARLPRLPYY